MYTKKLLEATMYEFNSVGEKKINLEFNNPNKMYFIAKEFNTPNKSLIELRKTKDNVWTESRVILGETPEDFGYDYIINADDLTDDETEILLTKQMTDDAYSDVYRISDEDELEVAADAFGDEAIYDNSVEVGNPHDIAGILIISNVLDKNGEIDPNSKDPKYALIQLDYDSDSQTYNDSYFLGGNYIPENLGENSFIYTFTEDFGDELIDQIAQTYNADVVKIVSPYEIEDMIEEIPDEVEEPLPELDGVFIKVCDGNNDFIVQLVELPNSNGELYENAIIPYIDITYDGDVDYDEILNVQPVYSEATDLQFGDCVYGAELTEEEICDSLCENYGWTDAEVIDINESNSISQFISDIGSLRGLSGS